jgi:hypothetical protein
MFCVLGQSVRYVSALAHVLSAVCCIASVFRCAGLEYDWIALGASFRPSYFFEWRLMAGAKPRKRWACLHPSGCVNRCWLLAPHVSFSLSHPSAAEPCQHWHTCGCCGAAVDAPRGIMLPAAGRFCLRFASSCLFIRLPIVVAKFEQLYVQGSACGGSCACLYKCTR